MNPAEVFAILRAEGLASDALRADFLAHWPACVEYRVGAGGLKVWADRYNERAPWVNCYRECETPKLRERMAAVNKRLVDAFDVAERRAPEEPPK